MENIATLKKIYTKEETHKDKITSYKEFRKEADYGDPNYSFYYKFVKRPISYPLTWLVYNTRLNPNELTYTGFAFFLLSAIFYSIGTYQFLIIGIIGFFIAELFDDFDGVIAKTKGIRSRRGGWLDILSGCVGKTIILAAISIGAFRSTANPNYLIFGLISVVGYSTYISLDHVTKIRFSVMVQKKMKFIEHKPNPKSLAGMLSILSEVLMNVWMVFFVLASIFNMMGEFVIYSAVYYSIYPLFLFLYLNRKYKDI
jgi:phosphatidylglycerophosphate synthase